MEIICWDFKEFNHIYSSGKLSKHTPFIVQKKRKIVNL